MFICLNEWLFYQEEKVDVNETGGLMLLIVAFSAGFVIGLLKAKRMNGRLLDLLHYGASFGIATTILSLFLEILILRVWG